MLYCIMYYYIFAKVGAGVELHELVKTIRLEMGISQKKLATELHVSFAAVNRWENKRTKPNQIARNAIVELAKSQAVSRNLIEELENMQ